MADKTFAELMGELGIKPAGIAAMETDGVTDEDTLKAHLNEARTLEVLKERGWVVSKTAFAKLIERYPLSAPTTPAVPDAFADLVAPLCKTLKMDATSLAKALKDIGDPDELVEYFSDGTVGEALLIGVLGATGNELMKVKIQQGLKNIAKAVEAAKPAPAPAAAPVVADIPANGGGRVAADMRLLPTLPEGPSLLELLRIGGVAKFSHADAVSAIRGSHTRLLGVDRVLPVLTDAVLAHAEAMDEPAPEMYFMLRRARSRRDYRDVLAAFDGAITSVSEADKKAFLTKVEGVWPTLKAFQAHLDAYRQLHKDEAADLSNLVQALRTGAGGIDYPDPTPVVSAARGVIDVLNKIFSGLGIPAARTIGKDLVEDGEHLANPALPGLIGAGNFTEMIKKLDLDVPSDAGDQERLIGSFVLALLELPKQTVDILPEYILALQRRGKAIVWPAAADKRTDPGRRSTTSGFPTPAPAKRPDWE